MNPFMSNFLKISPTCILFNIMWSYKREMEIKKLLHFLSIWIDTVYDSNCTFQGKINACTISRYYYIPVDLTIFPDKSMFLLDEINHAINPSC